MVETENPVESLYESRRLTGERREQKQQHRNALADHPGRIRQEGTDVRSPPDSSAVADRGSKDMAMGADRLKGQTTRYPQALVAPAARMAGTNDRRDTAAWCHDGAMRARARQRDVNVH